jgi:hypothetical protein
MQIIACAPRRKVVASQALCGRASNGGKRVRQFRKRISLLYSARACSQGAAATSRLRSKTRIGCRSAFAARLAVVSAVGIQYDRTAGQAALLAVAVTETLHAGKRVANRIGVVAVQEMRFAAKPRFDARRLLSALDGSPSLGSAATLVGS